MDEKTEIVIKLNINLLDNITQYSVSIDIGIIRVAELFTTNIKTAKDFLDNFIDDYYRDK